MMQTVISRGAFFGVAAALVVLLGVLFWWTSRQENAAGAYSQAVSERERSPEFSQVLEAEKGQQEEWKRNPEGVKAARELTRDKEFQPEK